MAILLVLDGSDSMCRYFVPKGVFLTEDKAQALTNLKCHRDKRGYAKEWCGHLDMFRRRPSASRVSYILTSEYHTHSEPSNEGEQCCNGGVEYDRRGCLDSYSDLRVQ